ncbi:hypothetical protein Cgig2_018543 [Carnegiea gigantea]|uniref:Uncharacterized protein n=1 Tax=Carnegiea gigantea TaxID=171969 RepID=A0A9Q1QKG9_9CARY|nr:hypothetical protein Cgig2_018543 [Carnegiea gigantea]
MIWKKKKSTLLKRIFLRVLINMTPPLITIPNDFKDDKEDIAVDIVKRKTSASEVVFSEATVLLETFAYHKLMGPESSGRVRRIGPGITSNQLNAKHNCQSGTEPSNSSIVSLLLKEGDNVKENQRNNTPLAGQIENSTVLSDKCGAAHKSRLPHSDDQNTSMGENTNTSGYSKQPNIARRLNFDQIEQGVSKGLSLTSTPSPLSRELMCSRVINPSATTQVRVFFLI